MSTKNPTPSADEIRDISEQVFRARLGPKDVETMLEEDADGGIKLRNRAASYDPLTRLYLIVITGRAR